MISRRIKKTMAPRISEFPYFVYGLLFPDGRIFYIGKGTDDRPYNHIGEARSGHLCLKCAVIRQILAQGHDISCVVLFETSDSDLALWCEMRAITSLPYGALCNANGGSRSHLVQVTQSSEYIWDAEVFQLQGTKQGRRIIAETDETRIACQLRAAPYYDALVLPGYLERVIYHADAVEDLWEVVSANTPPQNPPQTVLVTAGVSFDLAS